MQSSILRLSCLLLLLAYAGCSESTNSLTPVVGELGELRGSVNFFFVPGMDTISHAGVKVEAYIDGYSTPYTATTDSTGGFTLKVPTGSYMLRVAHKGYAEFKRYNVSYFAPGVRLLKQPLSLSQIPTMTLSNLRLEGSPYATTLYYDIEGAPSMDSAYFANLYYMVHLVVTSEPSEDAPKEHDSYIPEIVHLGGNHFRTDIGSIYSVINEKFSKNKIVYFKLYQVFGALFYFDLDGNFVYSELGKGSPFYGIVR